MANKPHKKLEGWKKAVGLTLKIYRLTNKLPDSEKFGLTSQMRRAAVSVASNIAEGAARNSKKEFVHFLFNAQGSLSELDTQILICKELGYVSEDDCCQVESDMETESKLIAGLIRSLRKKA
ncbi:MAG: four helix bundle protein [Deltaproteobacteria bacterium]|nr:four helix bundle protein [Deltaproteobacteria bacterium]